MSIGRSNTATKFHERLASALSRVPSDARGRVFTTAEIVEIYESRHGKLGKDKPYMLPSDHCNKTTARAKKKTGRCSICEAGAFLLLRVSDNGEYRLAPNSNSGSPVIAQVGDHTPTTEPADAPHSNLAIASPEDVSGAQPSDEGMSAAEGRELLRMHRLREREPKLIGGKKHLVLAEFGKLVCEVCGFDFAETYGLLGEGFAECHHDQPLSVGGERITQLSELSVVCANCHRMLHRRPWRTVAELRELVLSRRARSSTRHAP